MTTQWEYCVAAPVPTGRSIFVTFFHPHGADRTEYKLGVHAAHERDLQPVVVSRLGRDGWEMVGIDQGAMYFKRPLPNATKG